jgi:hypothetical protein
VNHINLFLFPVSVGFRQQKALAGDSWADEKEMRLFLPLHFPFLVHCGDKDLT